MNEAEFTDPRLVAIYDDLNSYEPGTQPDFYAALADELGAETIVELGAGTGLLASALARDGRRVIGVEPAGAMLAIARRRAPQLEWIEGDARAIGALDADLVIMSGHVAQFFETVEAWTTALSALHVALRPGGRLAFESRNPGAREWERWTRANARTVATRAGVVEHWGEVDAISGGVVAYRNHFVFVETGEAVVSAARLRFRSIDELTRSLDESGFAVDEIFGDWDRRPAGSQTRELIVVARRR
jgi:SAM-dependent methyltransferase